MNYIIQHSGVIPYLNENVDFFIVMAGYLLMAIVATPLAFWVDKMCKGKLL